MTESTGNSRYGMIKRFIASSRTSILITAVALIGVACGPGPLPAADPTAGSTPAPIEQRSPISDDFQAEPVAAEPVSVNDEQVAEPPPEQPAPVAPQMPPTSDDWEDVTANLEGLASTCGNISNISSDPQRDQVIVGVSGHGLFEYDDEAVAWNPMGTGEGSTFINNRLGWIEYDPIVPERFWQAGKYGDGVYQTEDNGVTFSRLGDLRHLDYVSVDQTDPFRAVMMVGVHEESVIYRSDDGGDNWQDLSESLPEGIGFTPYPIVFTPSTHLLGTYRSNTSGVFQSQDAGATWTRTYEGEISGPPVVDGDNVFWLTSNGGGVIRSSNRGFSFEAGASTGGRPMTLTQLSDGRLVTHNKNRVLISDDLGESWRSFGPELPYEPRGVAVTEDGEAIFAWRFTCNFSEPNPVLPLSIIRLDADFDQS